MAFVVFRSIPQFTIYLRSALIRILPIAIFSLYFNICHHFRNDFLKFLIFPPISSFYQYSFLHFFLYSTVLRAVRSFSRARISKKGSYNSIQFNSLFILQFLLNKNPFRWKQEMWDNLQTSLKSGNVVLSPTVVTGTPPRHPGGVADFPRRVNSNLFIFFPLNFVNN